MILPPAGPDTISDISSLQDYSPLAQKASSADRKAAVTDAAHKASTFLHRIAEHLPERSVVPPVHDLAKCTVGSKHAEASDIACSQVNTSCDSCLIP